MNSTKAAPVKMADLGRRHRQLGKQFEQAALEVLADGRFLLGPHLQKFERECASLLEVEHALGCASGTDALTLALLALGVEPGDEVITSPFSFIASAESVFHAGATPVFADIEAGGFALDPVSVAAAINERTKAIMTVHLYGEPSRLDELSALAQKHGIPLVEDCAQAFGACHHPGTATPPKRQFVGGIGDIGCFSFYPVKNLGGFGDGGLVTTRDPALARSIELLRNHGSIGGYQHELIGYTSRLDDIQAALLNVQLPFIEEWNQKRAATAEIYNRELAQTPLRLPRPTAGHVYNQYTLLCGDTQERGQLQEFLGQRQIETRIYYPLGLHRQPSVSSRIQTRPLRNCEEACQQCLSIPIHPWLEADEIERVCKGLDDFYAA